MTAHQWAASGIGLGRRFRCGGCGVDVFSYEKPQPWGPPGATLLVKPSENSGWVRSNVLPDCDEESVKGVMES